MNPQTNTTTQPDLQALALTKAIRQQESGGNYNASGDAGTSTGAYQYQPNTWKQYVGQILGDQNAPMTPENQNAVTYGMVKTWKDSGMGPAEIAAKWNSGSNTGWENKVGTTNINGQAIDYNVPQYVQGVVNNFKQIYPQVQQQYGGTNTAQSSQTQDQSPSVSGFVGNVFSSGANLVGGLAHAVMHPIDTATNLLGTVGGAIEKPFGINNADTQKFDALVGYMKNRYGGDNMSEIVHNIGHTLYSDPAGAALDLSTVIDGVGASLGAIGKIADISKIPELTKAADFITTASGVTMKAGSPEAAAQFFQQPGTLTKLADSVKTIGKYTNPMTPVVSGAGKILNIGSDILQSTYAKSIGLNNRADVQFIIDHPEQVSKVAREQLNRGSIMDELSKSVDEAATSKSEVGKMYDPIRKSGATTAVPENFLQDILSKGAVDETGKAIPFKFNLVKNPDGSLQVVADTKSFTRDPRDIGAIQNFVNTWGNKTNLTAEEFLNMRSDLSKMAKFGRELGKNDAAELVAKAIRAEANKYMRPNIPDLAATDAKAAPEYEKWNEISKTLLSADKSTFKNGAISKIFNTVKKGHNPYLDTLEKLSPGITEKLTALKTIESIESAYNIKAGTYMKDMIGTAALLHGNFPVVFSAIISHPAIAVKLLQAYGYTAKTVKPLLNMLKIYAGDPAMLKYAAQAGILSNVGSVGDANQNNK